MDEILVTAIDHYLQPAVEAIGAAIIVLGVLFAVLRYLLSLLGFKEYSHSEIQLYLVRYLMLGLTFQVGADILGTAVTPTIIELGILAGIVVIRAALSYFLSKDLEQGFAETQKHREDG